MAVLVTGAGGFVGRHLVRALLRQGGPVRALSRGPHDPACGAGSQWWPCDVNDEAALQRALRGCTTVYHAAGVVPARGSAGLWETNVGGTRRVALACRHAGVKRLVLVSSVAAYRPPLAAVVPESAPTGGRDLYGRSKAEAEAEARQACGDAVELVILRPCQVYGPGDGSGYTRRLLALCGWPLLPVAGWHGCRFSLLHVRDAVAALVAAGEVPAAAGATLNVAPEAGVSVPELARLQAALRDGRPGLCLPLPPAVLRAALGLRARIAGAACTSYAPGHTHGSLLLGGPLYDTRQARSLLGFRARTLPAQGLAELLVPSEGGRCAC